MHKYHAKKMTTPDGILHDSTAEGNRWWTLVLMQRAGEITDLQRQVVFPLLVNGIQIGKYKADSIYTRDGQRIIEDVKGVRTPMFNRSAKHMDAQGDPITIYPPKSKKVKKCRQPKKCLPTAVPATESSKRTPRSRKS